MSHSVFDLSDKKEPFNLKHWAGKVAVQIPITVFIFILL